MASARADWSGCWRTFWIRTAKWIRRWLHILKLKDGNVTTGLVRREQDGALVYADVTGQEHSVPKGDVTGDDVSPFSLMPSGLGEVLTEQQLHDLLAYLLERK